MFNCLAIDLGAGSGRIMRCTISDDRKISLEEISRFPNESRMSGGLLRWDIQALLKSIFEGLKKAAEEQRPDAVAVDTWGVDYVLLDKAGNLLEEPVCYRDNRTAAVMDEFLEKFGSDRLKALTGIQIMNFNTVFQLYAASKADPDYAAKADRLLFTPDYIAYRLCGKKANEFTIASTSSLLDCHTRTWSDELLELVKLPRRCVSEPTPPGTMIGTCDFSGIPGLEGVPCVMVASHDTGSGVAAVPASGDDWAYICSGTWCLTGIESKVALATPRQAELNFTNEGGVAGTWRVLKNLTGFWILRGIREEAAGKMPYDDMMKLARESTPFKALFDPNDPVFFNPSSMKEAIDGCLKKNGQPALSTPGEYTRAFLESLALLFRKTVREADSLSGKTTRVVHLLGGGVRNSTLCQFTADATGCRVLAGPVEATAVGNAVMQAVAVGKLKDIAEARSLIRSSFQPSEYLPHTADAWEEAAARFEKLVR